VGVPALVASVALLFPAAAISQWIAVGPDGGSVLSLGVDAHDAARILAGTSHGGVFRSLDGGESWQAWSEGLEEPMILTVAWGGPEGTALSGTATGIWRRGPGESWARVSSSPTGPIYELVFEPGSASSVYAGTDHSGVHRSADGGRSWSAAGLSGQLIRSLQFDANRRLWAAANSGIHRSDNGGGSWSSRTPDLGGASGTFNAIGLDSSDGNRAWTIAQSRLFRSVDGGGTWSNTIGPLAAPANVIRVRPGDPMSLEIALGGALGGVVRTNDAGATWIFDAVSENELMMAEPPTPLSSPLPGSFGLVRAPEAIVAGTERGVFRLSDGAQSWTPSSRGLAVQEIAALERFGGRLLTSTSDGLMFRTDEGGRWRIVPAGSGIAVPETFFALRADDATGTIWSAAGTGVYRSSDGGATWQRFFAQHGLLHSARSVAVTSAGTPLVGTFLGGVYRSLDGGSSWQASNTGLSNLTVRALDVDPQAPGTVWAGTDAGLFRSASSGESWSAASGSLSGAAVAAVSDGAAPGLVLAGTRDGRIHRSTDAGASWSVAHTAASGSPVTALDSHGDGLVVAGTESGEVLVGTAGASSWTGLPGSPLPAPVTSLRFSEDGRAVFAGLAGRSVHRLDLIVADRDAPVRPTSPARPPRVVPPR
jgi:photosystem II stability/assembly factor-like uncharacterized protein